MSIKVIVIDDDEDTLDTFCAYLELKDFEIVGKGKDGREAVEIYEKTRPDVVLLDIMMPHYDGFFALERIKKIDPNAKIVVVTGDLTENTADRLRDMGASEMLYKPYEIDEIVKVVTCVVQGKKIRL